jgi:hypothetical protein
MTAGKSIGIWLDHSNAHVIVLAEEMKTMHVDSTFTHLEKEESLAKSEHTMHNKEHGEQLAYFKALGEIIKQYQTVLLFGPTDAKKELHNYLLADRHFADIKIHVRSADKMTEHQEHAFVKDYFHKMLK